MVEDRNEKHKRNDSGTKMLKRSFEQKVKSSDIFGKRVYLTHNGLESYQTTGGGTISIIFLIFMLAYSLNSFAKVWNHVLKSVSFQTLYLDSNNTDVSLSINQTGFDFAIGFNNHLPPEIGNI